MYIFKCNNHISIYNQSKVKWMNLNWGEILKIFAKKWDFFRNEPTPSFSETPAFKTKLSWNPPKGEPCLEVYLRQVEKELFWTWGSTFGLFQLYKKTMDSNKKFGRWSQHNYQKSLQRFLCSIWDRNYYIFEKEKQMADKNIYQDVNFSDRILRDQVDKSNKIFRSLKSQGKVTEKELKYFTYGYQKATNLDSSSESSRIFRYLA